MFDLIADTLLWICYFFSLFFSLFWLVVLFENSDRIKSKPTKKLDYDNLPTVTVVLPAWNEEKRGLRQTIESVLRLNYPRDKLEVIAVDHGSVDKTGAIMDEYADRLTVAHISRTNKDQKGVAMNYGLKRAKGEYFVCMDCDSKIERDALLKLLPHFDNDNVACVLPMMKVNVGESRFEKLQHFEYLVNLFYKKIMGFLDCIHVAPGPFSVYRTEILRKVGGYENYNITEDLELTVRLQKNDYEIKQTMDAIVTTLAPNNMRDFYKQRHRWFRGGVITAIKHKDMIFNKKYGDFGLMQMPLLILSGVIALTLLSLIIIMGIKSNIKIVYNLFLIDFEFWVFFKSFLPSFHILDLSFPTIVVMFFTILMSAIMLLISFRATNEKLTRFGFVNLLIFIAFYFFILAVVWLGVLKDFVLRKSLVWR